MRLAFTSNHDENSWNGSEFSRLGDAREIMAVFTFVVPFERLVAQLIDSGETTAVIVTHGGVITTLLSIYGLPQAESYRWQMDNGFGYSMRITPMLWMRDKVAEIYDYCPPNNEEEM